MAVMHQISEHLNQFQDIICRKCTCLYTYFDVVCHAFTCMPCPTPCGPFIVTHTICRFDDCLLALSTRDQNYDGLRCTASSHVRSVPPSPSHRLKASIASLTSSKLLPSLMLPAHPRCQIATLSNPRPTSGAKTKPNSSTLSTSSRASFPHPSTSCSFFRVSANPPSQHYHGNSPRCQQSIPLYSLDATPSPL